MTESDIRQNFDLVSHISFSEFDENLQHPCQSLCNQERSWDCQSNTSSYHSTYESLLKKGASHFQSENTLLQQQSPQNYNDYVADNIEDSNCVKFQSHSLSACSVYEITCIEESKFDSIIEEGSLCVYQAHISAVYNEVLNHQEEY